jgi:RecB family exonuclease
MSAAAVAVSQTTGVADVLSPSQVGTFLDCQYRWYAKHQLHLPDSKTPALALGTAVHAGMSATWHHKLETGIDLPLDQVIDAYATKWTEESAKVEFAGKNNKDEMVKQGAVMIAKYMEEAEPAIHPQAVDYEVRGFIAGVYVRGYIDLVQIDGTVVDLKTAGRTPSAISPSHLFQMTTYTQLVKDLDINGLAREDTLVKLKAPKLVQLQHEIGLQDYHYTRQMYPLVQEQMRQGLFAANRQSFLCNRAKCPYWRACEREFGGTVPGGDGDE